MEKLILSKKAYLLILLAWGVATRVEGGTENGGGGDGCVAQYKTIASNLVEAVNENQKLMSKLGPSKIAQLKTKLIKANVFASSADYLTDPKTGKPVEAINDGRNNVKVGQAWCRKEYDEQKNVLVLHEALSLIGIEGSQKFDISGLMFSTAEADYLKRENKNCSAENGLTYVEYKLPNYTQLGGGYGVGPDLLTGCNSAENPNYLHGDFTMISNVRKKIRTGKIHKAVSHSLKAYDEKSLNQLKIENGCPSKGVGSSGSTTYFPEVCRRPPQGADGYNYPEVCSDAYYVYTGICDVPEYKYIETKKTIGMVRYEKNQFIAYHDFRVNEEIVRKITNPENVGSLAVQTKLNNGNWHYKLISIFAKGHSTYGSTDPERIVLNKGVLKKPISLQECSTKIPNFMGPTTP